jgi:hypothetical protein
VPEVKIKLTSGETVVVFVPKEINPSVKKMIKETLKSSANKSYAEQLIHEFENLSVGVEVLIEHLKTDKVYSKKSEKLIRQLIAIYLERGLRMGKYIHEKPEKILDITRMEHPNIRAGLKRMRKKKRWITEYMIHSFLLGKQCYETGLALSAVLSLSKIKEYQGKLEKEVDEYIW